MVQSTISVTKELLTVYQDDLLALSSKIFKYVFSNIFSKTSLILDLFIGLYLIEVYVNEPIYFVVQQPESVEEQVM